jgi:hypothetical protein
MGIHSLKEELKDIPGIGQLVMSYEDGGKVQVFSIGEIKARVGPMAQIAEIRLALLRAIDEAAAK